jgi:[protein-PII] uridylyltransferase
MRIARGVRVAQHHDVELSARAADSPAAPRIDDAFRADPEASAFFRQILGSPTRVSRTLQTMDEVGLLGAYLPEFAHLVEHVAAGHVHTYTVDIHSLFLVEAAGFSAAATGTRLALATELMREVRNPVLLYLGCILHDIGKGHGGGHSGKGAAMVPELASVGLSAEDTAIVEFPVPPPDHERDGRAADVHDPRLILRLAKLCGSGCICGSCI